MTPEEERRGERLDERLAREEPDGSDRDRADAGQLVDDGAADTEKDLVADHLPDEVER